ncbi:MAG: hypothetical protein FWB90_01270 [Fibromonadales bacterium]|nr:hypothetical protein [Fibromonadales bacterium]
MHFVLFLTVFFAVGTGFAASLIGTDALGMEQAPKNSVIIRNGFAPQNPAIHAFENKTKFGTTILFEYAWAQKDKEAIAMNSFTVPSISMVLPLGFAGAFGIGLEQKYFASNRLELIDTALNANVLYNSRVGIYELLPSYSIRLPFLTDFAIGTSYRILFGNSYSTLELGSNKDWGDEAWMTRNVFITEKEIGTFESASDWWRNFGYSLHFHKKNVDYFISYFPSIQVEKDIKKNVQFSNLDTLQSELRTETFTLPKRFASGVHFRFWKNQNASLAYEAQKDEDENIVSWFAFAEYKLSGTGLYYSPFFQRNDFGINAWFAEKCSNEVNEYGASIFSDLWLGRKGTLVGIALFGGYRQAKEPYWDEPFFGFKFSLTGVGNWGTSVRRR